MVEPNHEDDSILTHVTGNPDKVCKLNANNNQLTVF